MADNKLGWIVIIAWGAIACTAPKNTPAKTPNPLVVSSTCDYLEKSMINDEIIEETTVGTISNHLVGVSNIWEWEIPDDKGVIAPRLSANISIQDITTKRSWEEKAFAGKVISLGSDRYCVVQVKYGESSSGSVTLRKIP
jgi:hypothetical protein